MHGLALSLFNSPQKRSRLSSTAATPIAAKDEKLRETAIAEEYAKLQQRDGEHANRTKPRRKKARRARSRGGRE